MSLNETGPTTSGRRIPLDSSVLVPSFSNLLKSLVACSEFTIHRAKSEMISKERRLRRKRDVLKAMSQDPMLMVNTERSNDLEVGIGATPRQCRTSASAMVI